MYRKSVTREKIAIARATGRKIWCKSVRKKNTSLECQKAMDYITSVRTEKIAVTL
jgi:hypothetical protein